MNLDTLIEVARFVKQNGAKTRLNTNGLASAQYDRDVAAMLKDVIDEMSISLNDSDAKKYDDICHSRFGLNAYGYMLDFARDCEDTEPLQIINEIGVDIYPVGVYYKDS